MLYPRKRFGQHFLRDAQILQRMSQSIRPQLSDHLVEIGPGQGALTDYLVGKTKQFDLIEIDRDLIEILKKRYQMNSEVNIFSADVLKFAWSEIGVANSHEIRLVGNLPYNISTPLLVKILREMHYFKDAHFLLQKEVAERLCAPVNDKHYGRLAVLTQCYCQPELLFYVKPEAFHPPPKVWSAFVRLLPHSMLPLKIEDKGAFLELVKLAFMHRRKTIANNLKSVIAADMLSNIGIDPMDRPQALSIADFIKINNYLKNNL